LFPFINERRLSGMTNPADSLVLYRYPLSGHSHRAELLLALAALPYELVDVDLTAGAHKRPDFLAKNAFGLVPVLVHGDFVITESNAILVYLAEQFPSARAYWPADAKSRALVQRWLSIASGPLLQGPGTARVIRVFGRNLDATHAATTAEKLFRIMEDELSGRDFLVGSAPTLADIAMYTYTAHAPEGGISLEAYGNIRAWLARIEALPRFVPMQPAPQRG
jgi:glutathione S-transferase